MSSLNERSASFAYSSTHEDNTYAIHEGSVLENLTIVKSGTLISYSLMSDGEEVPNGFYNKGSLICEEAMFEGNARYSYKTFGTTVLDHFKCNKILPNDWCCIAKNVSKRSAEQSRMINAFKNYEVTYRIAYVLLQLAASDQQTFLKDVQLINVTLPRLAHYCSINPHTLSHRVRIMQREGLLIIGYKNIGIVNKDFLQQMIEGGEYYGKR